MNPISIRARETEQYVVLAIEGGIDINASSLIEAVGWYVTHRTKHIICDFSEVERIDYVGVSVVAIAYKNALNHNRKIKFCNVPGHVAQLFTLTGLQQAVESYPSAEMAAASFAGDTTSCDSLKQKLRRRFKRVDMRELIEYRLTDTGGVYYSGHIVNVSAVGVFMISETVFDLGAVVDVRMHLLPTPGIFEARARVIWVVQKNMHLMESAGMGLEFIHMDADQQKRIIEFVEKNFARDIAEGQ